MRAITTDCRSCTYTSCIDLGFRHHTLTNECCGFSVLYTKLYKIGLEYWVVSACECDTIKCEKSLRDCRVDSSMISFYGTPDMRLSWWQRLGHTLVMWSVMHASISCLTSCPVNRHNWMFSGLCSVFTILSWSAAPTKIANYVQTWVPIGLFPGLLTVQFSFAVCILQAIKNCTLQVIKNWRAGKPGNEARVPNTAER